MSLPNLHTIQPVSDDYPALTLESALSSPMPPTVHLSGRSGGIPVFSPISEFEFAVGYNSRSGLDSDSLPCDYEPQAASENHRCEPIIPYKNAESWSMSERAPETVGLKGQSKHKARPAKPRRTWVFQELTQASNQSSQTAIRERRGKGFGFQSQVSAVLQRL